MKALPLSLCVGVAFAACTKSDRTTQQPEDTPVSSLRLLRAADGTSVHELRWSPPDRGPEPDGYVVYRADFPLNAQNRERAVSRTVGPDGDDRNTAGPETRFDLPPGSGVHWFAVAPLRDSASDAGPLSTTLRIDTTERIAWIESDDEAGTRLVVGDLGGRVLDRRSIGSTEIDPQWSPTGALLVWIEDGLVHVIDPSKTPGRDDGTRRTSVVPPVRAEVFAFDATGSRIALLGRERGRDTGLQLFRRRIDLDASSPVTMAVRRETRVADFTWSNDGETLLYIGNHRTVDADQLSVESDEPGGTVVNHELAPGETVVGAAWAPGRRSIAYLAAADDGRHVALWRVDVDLGRRGIASIDVAPGDEVIRWSPDGAQLAAVLQTEDDAAANLWIFGSGSAAAPIELADGEAVGAIEWAPDAIALAVHVTGGAAPARLLAVAAADDLTVRSLHPGLAVGETIADFAWSPRGTQVAALVRGDGYARVDVLTAAGQLVHAHRRDSIDRIGWAEDDRRIVLLAAGRLLVLEATGTIRPIRVEEDAARVVDFSVVQLGWRAKEQIRAKLDFGPGGDVLDEAR